MRYSAGDVGCTTVLGDVVSVQAPWTAAPIRSAGQGSSVARLRTGDREAAEELFNACYPRLAGWVRRLGDDDETAHEVASQAITRLLARWAALGSPPSSSLTAAAPADPVYQPVQDVDVRALIEALPAKLRSAFLLHYYAGFGVREVAAMLGRPEGTIKADLYHARSRLKAAIGDAGD